MVSHVVFSAPSLSLGWVITFHDMPYYLSGEGFDYFLSIYLSHNNHDTTLLECVFLESTMIFV